MIFRTMMEREGELPVVSHKASGQEITAYFEQILPDYDQDRVYLSDIKKIIKWYRKLEEKGLLASDEEE